MGELVLILFLLAFAVPGLLTYKILRDFESRIIEIEKKTKERI